MFKSVESYVPKNLIPRPKFIKFHMKTALNYAELSPAKRRKVGAVLVSEDNSRVLMIGYNGTPPGYSNECEDLIDGELVTKPEVIHAEENLLLFCAREGISTKNKILYVTTQPCLSCAKMIITSGIKFVFYYDSYTNSDGMDFLYKNKIPCWSLNESN